MQETDYAEAGHWLESLGQRMEGFDLANIRKLCELSRVDPAKLRAVHVAGSNGKGSTCAFIERMLREAGYKTGLYTSPHLVKETERLTINGRKISEKRFAELAADYREIIEKHAISASYFEAISAMAFKYFYEEKVDFLVAETGMGGRLDATNILSGIVNVITSISLEHTQYLGSTLGKIAAEKAGIIKENSAVVALPNNAGLKEIKEKAAEKNSALLLPKYEIISATHKGSEFDMLSPVALKSLKIKMAGKHQCENACIAVCAIHALRQKGVKISEQAIRVGLEKTFWPGRMEKIHEKPAIVLDAAHNPEGWRTLFDSLKLYEYEKLFVIFGAMADKDIAPLKSLLEKNNAMPIATKSRASRAQDPEKIREQLGRGEVADSVGKAIELALKKTSEKDLIVVTGSIAVLGEAYEYFGIET